VDPWSNTTHSAANPRSASSHASRLCFGAAAFAVFGFANVSDISPDVTAPGRAGWQAPSAGTVAGTKRDR
jgi:hypothetical protein